LRAWCSLPFLSAGTRQTGQNPISIFIVIFGR
jgi:hypothetical protein